MVRLLAKRPELPVIGLLLFVLCSPSCRHQKETEATAMLPTGEPEIYSATLTRTAVNGEWRQQEVSKVERRGDWRREDWTDPGGRRAQILRPDLGKGYILDLDRQIYVEFDYGQAAPAAGGAGAPPASPTASEPVDPEAGLQSQAVLSPAEVEGTISDAPAPVTVESRRLPDQKNQGFVCQVIERRSTFGGGQVEVTRSVRAPELAGLPLLIEVESPSGAKLTIERTDVRLEAPPGDFSVPSGFKKVDQLPAPQK